MKKQPKLNLQVFLDAAQLIDSEMEEFSCRAIQRVKNYSCLYPNHYSDFDDNSEEFKFYVNHFKPKDARWGGAWFSYMEYDSFGGSGGVPEYSLGKKWRVQALLLCYQLARDYNRNRH